MSSLFETDLSPVELLTEPTVRYQHPKRDELSDLIPSWNVLMLPGWNGASPSHWQSIWEQKYPTVRRIEQRDWERPIPEEWTHEIDAEVTCAKNRVILIAHSLACVAVASWAERHPRSAQQVAAALLVTPADVSDPSRCPAILRSFAPIPTQKLPFQSHLIGSENDPYMPLPTASKLARDWGSKFINAGAVGHINCASGNGPWPEGEQYLRNLIDYL